jgi:hypothetical protein
MHERRFFTHIVIGTPQIFAMLLLAAYAVQCVALMARVPFSLIEQDHIWAGRQQLEYGAVPRSFGYSPLPNIVAAAPMRMDENRVPAKNPTGENVRKEVRRLRWMLRTPFLLMGVLLGVSLWYVSRRLYGNVGGYVALSLYCFSPAMVLRGAMIQEQGPAAWGVFGIVFTGIAISHNLYAPWKKWRYRTLLLSLAIALAVASHPAAMFVLPVTFAFMLYLAPQRRWAAILVLVVATLAGAALTLAAYGFHPGAMLDGIDLRQWMRYTPQGAQQVLLKDPRNLFERFNPAVLLLLLISLLTYLFWKRTRYFGNTAPLLVAAGLLYYALVSPMALVASVWALPIVFVFIGGMWADLLETRHRLWIAGVLLLLLMENAYYCLTMVHGSL